MVKCRGMTVRITIDEIVRNSCRFRKYGPTVNQNESMKSCRLSKFLNFYIEKLKKFGNLKLKNIRGDFRVHTGWVQVWGNGIPKIQL